MCFASSKLTPIGFSNIYLQSYKLSIFESTTCFMIPGAIDEGTPKYKINDVLGFLKEFKYLLIFKKPNNSLY